LAIRERERPSRLSRSTHVCHSRSSISAAARPPNSSLCGEGLCIGYDGGDAVSADYGPPFQFTNGTIIKVVFDVADDAYIDVERHLAAAMARD
jgi:hypothetical protein